MTEHLKRKIDVSVPILLTVGKGEADLLSARRALNNAEIITATVLNAALVRSRKRYKSMTRPTECVATAVKSILHQDVDLWGLLEEEICAAINQRPNEEALTAALLAYQGVALISDALWEQRQIEDSLCGDSGFFQIRIGEENYLLSDDPWATPATSALMSSRATGVRLAMARAKQWQEILSHCNNSALCLNARETHPMTSSPIDATTLQGSDGSPESIDIVQFVDDVIAHAARECASDIHFEMGQEGLTVKFRLDGVMSLGPQLIDRQRSVEVVSRIKVMAQLDITESRRPQDGRIHWSKHRFAPLDLRVSVMPSILGEDVVLRLLDKSHFQSKAEGRADLTLQALGFEPTLVDGLRELAQRPHGMLLVTGPTGSGKTTTVYAALSEANDGLEKIITIEDPVEYQLRGVLQIPVNEQKGLTFATGLRSILRHDPDKILVGEIRDAETAQIAVQSALTGHMVFTTVHANSLFDVLGRFQHFGIEPFALASALNGVVVQRLLRKLCPQCNDWRLTTEKENYKLQSLGLATSKQLPTAAGCDLCRQTGYRGRIVTAEVHTISDNLRELIATGASMEKLSSALYPDSAGRLLARTMSKVWQGQTTLEEVRRVVGLA